MSEKNTGPVEVQSPVTQMGSTFAERKAAREGAAKKAATPAVKQVDGDGAENKAVSSSESKARKKS